MDITKLKFRIKIACRIARVDRDRFNEAVAAGNYGCAPRVQRGSTRVFDENDLIALFIYGRLLDDENPPKIAGRLACRVLSSLKQKAAENEEEVVIVRSSSGFSEVWLGSQIKEPLRTVSGGAWVYRRDSYDIGNIRRIIRHEVEEEAPIFGADDED